METALNRNGRVHGEYNAADASTAGEVTWYELGTVDSRAQQDDERVALLSAVISSDAATRVQVFADADDDNEVDAGEALIDVLLAAGGAITLNFTEHNMPEGPAGAKLHIVSADEAEVSAVFEAILRVPITRTP